MPRRNDSGVPAADPAGGRPGQRPSRRSVLRSAAGAGAAGIAATALSSVAAPAMAATAKARPAGAHVEDADTSDQIVVHVRNARSGDIDVFRGTSQTSVRDRELAARLVRASRG